MIITKNNLIKIALSLQQKQVLLKSEKVFLKCFSIIKFLVYNGFNISLTTLSISIIKQLKIIKTAVQIKKLKAGEFYTNNFCYNVFFGNLKNVVLSKSGYIKVYENNNYKFLNLLVLAQNVFINSRVLNLPNKTIIFNKHFRLKIYIDGNKLTFSCNKIIDNFSSKSFYISLSTAPCLTLSNEGLTAVNLLLLNSCKQVKFSREAQLSGKNSAFCFGCEVFNEKSMQNYICFATVTKLLNFLEKSFLLTPIYLNNFNKMQTEHKQQIVLRKINGANQVIKSSTFCMHFFKGVFYAKSLLSTATFKLTLPLGLYKIMFIAAGLKIINLTEGHTFYISTNCKIKSAQILNGELVCTFCGNIKFCISNSPSIWREVAPHTHSTLLKLERIFLNNIVKTLFSLSASFYEQNKINNKFYEQLKQVIKNKQSLRYAAQLIIRLANTAKNETELKKLFKLSGLISSLPEKKANLTDYALRQNLSLIELEQLTLEEQLELYKIQQNPLDKNAKVC